jgi:hypothetical protein
MISQDTFLCRWQVTCFHFPCLDISSVCNSHLGKDSKEYTGSWSQQENMIRRKKSRGKNWEFEKKGRFEKLREEEEKLNEIRNQLTKGNERSSFKEKVFERHPFREKGLICWFFALEFWGTRNSMKATLKSDVVVEDSSRVFLSFSRTLLFLLISS